MAKTQNQTQSALEFTDENFEAEVLNSNLPVLVDFWADWCPPCKAIGPTVEEIAAEYEGRAKVGKVDTDGNPDAPTRYNIQSIPTLLVFKDGNVVERFVGLTGKQDLKNALDKVV
ncbi:MAG: thioredoxin [Phycisphaerales bacterium]|nr:thioredoxin [Phycisphaerales bacterium]